MKNHLLVFTFFFFVLPPFFSQTPPAEEKFLLSTAVYFDFGKHDLKKEADSLLLELAKQFQGRANLSIKITAHTDSIGSLKDNVALSQRRCEAVSSRLIENGLPANWFSTNYFGEIKPAASNSTDDGRQLNRRATIEVFQTTPWVLLRGRTADVRTGKGLIAEVVVHSKDFRDSLTTDTSGFFQKYVPPGIVVGIDAFSKCYFLESLMLKTEYDLPLQKIDMKPANTGQKADIQNLYYVGNQAVLLEKSKPELPKILRFMQMNTGTSIEIAGHVNYPNRPRVTTESWEFKLSEARAKLVYDFLLGNGIPKNRISWKGYGNWEMRFPNAIGEEQQALNRRVEIKVLGSECE